MIWDVVKYFSPREKWGDPSKVSGTLILVMDAVREAYGDDPSLYSFILHCAYELSGHSDNSYHYIGKAADFHIRNKSTKELFSTQVFRMVTTLRELQITDFVGLGIYPQWNSPGFHLDVRGERAR
jgi:hypothetical protein